MRLLTFFTLFYSVLSSACAQSIWLIGRLQTQATQAAIPYVNSSIRGHAIGTVADDRGTFSLRVLAAQVADTLTFSAISYQEQAVIISQLATE